MKAPVVPPLHLIYLVVFCPVMAYCHPMLCKSSSLYCQLQVVTSLLLLLYNLPTPWIALPVVAIVVRELTVSSLREWLAGRNLRHLVKVSPLGKAKTATQMISMTLLLLMLPLPVPTIAIEEALSTSSWKESFVNFVQKTSFAGVAGLGITPDAGRLLLLTGVLLFYVSTFLTVLSGGLYVQAAWPVLTHHKKEQEENPPTHEASDPLPTSSARKEL